MKKSLLWVGFVVVLAGFLFVLYLRHQEDALEPERVAVTETPVAQEEPAAIRHPIPDPPDEEEGPPPTLDESDRALRDRFAALFGNREFSDLILLDHVIRRIVITVDNLPRKTLPQKYLPLTPAGDSFLTEGGEDTLVISENNFRRYTPYVRLVEAIDREKLVATYVRYYPLFQQAYEELGYPDAYFNDRLVEVLDHLIATPQVQYPVALVRPKVVYHFADPKLEELSAGRKILVRIGPDHSAAIKNFLAQLRSDLGSAPVTSERNP